jgi:hypothetical protein
VLDLSVEEVGPPHFTLQGRYLQSLLVHALGRVDGETIFSQVDLVGHQLHRDLQDGLRRPCALAERLQRETNWQLLALLDLVQQLLVVRTHTVLSYHGLQALRVFDSAAELQSTYFIFRLAVKISWLFRQD